MPEFPTFEIVSEDDAPELTLGQMQNQKEQRAHELAESVFATLQADLVANGATERCIDLPLLRQQFGADCAIACARMAMTKFGYEDRGTQGFLTDAKSLDITVPTTIDSAGNTGPRADISIIQPILAKYGIVARFITGPRSGASFAEALKAGNLVQLSIDFHTLHPNDNSELSRNHAVIVKGYRVNASQDLVLVVNDPSPLFGGELELSQPILERALEYPFIIYERQ